MISRNIAFISNSQSIVQFFSSGEYVICSSKLNSDSQLPKKMFIICFSDSPSKMMKNAFCFLELIKYSYACAEAMACTVKYHASVNSFSIVYNTLCVLFVQSRWVFHFWLSCLGCLTDAFFRVFSCVWVSSAFFPFVTNFVDIPPGMDYYYYYYYHHHYHHYFYYYYYYYYHYCHFFLVFITDVGSAFSWGLCPTATASHASPHYLERTDNNPFTT